MEEGKHTASWQVINLRNRLEQDTEEKKLLNSQA